MKKLYWFNAGYEEEIAAGHLTANIRRMRDELSLLPLWYADEGDLVLSEGTVRQLGDFLNDLPPDFPPTATALSRAALRAAHATLPPDREGEYLGLPWGLSPQSCKRFEELAKDCPAGLRIVPPRWKEDYVRLTHRRTAGHCLGLLGQSGRFAGIEAVIPTFLHNEDDVERYLAGAVLPQVAKRPFSSSGRGLLRLDSAEVSEKERAWLDGAIRRQGCVGLERWLDKVTDLAMEYHINEAGHATCHGLSVFDTDRGAYLGNRLESQEQSVRHLRRYIGERRLQEIAQAVGDALATLYGGRYAGYLGVDMLVYREWDRLEVHPCVEINMRYTMGMAAIDLYRRYVHPDAKPGIFRIAFAHSAYTEHSMMEHSAPRIWKAGRLLKGYLPLCPVTPETRYRAYLWLP
jgi:hypothetical protein